MKKADVLPILKLPPKEAIAYLENKGYKITFAWDALSQKAHQTAFTVAGVMKMEMLKILRDFTQKSLAKGITFEEFRNGIQNRFAEAGLSSTFIAKDKAGNKKTVSLTPSRLRTIFRTNVQSAYNAGRLKGQEAVAAKSTVPMFYLYNATIDKRTRPEHKKLDGLCLPVSDPIWKSIYPPNGYNCRCSVSMISEEQAKQFGITIAKKAPANVDISDTFKGEPSDNFTPDVSRYDADLQAQFKREQAGNK